MASTDKGVGNENMLLLLLLFFFLQSKPTTKFKGGMFSYDDILPRVFENNT